MDKVIQGCDKAFQTHCKGPTLSFWFLFIIYKSFKAVAFSFVVLDMNSVKTWRNRKLFWSESCMSSQGNKFSFFSTSQCKEVHSIKSDETSHYLTVSVFIALLIQKTENGCGGFLAPIRAFELEVRRNEECIGRGIIQPQNPS